MEQSPWYLIFGSVIGAVITYLYLRVRFQQHRTFQDHLQAAGEQLLNLAKEKLGAEKEVIRTDLEGKRDAIKSMVEEIRKQMDDTKRYLTESEKQRLSSFASLQKELESHRLMTGELRANTEDLKKLLSNNQLRGAFGERVASDLLQMAGFVIGQDYLIQTQAGVTRPDITLLLPDNTKVQIDVKFPYNNLQRYTEAQNEQERQKYMKLFRTDVREKIKQIAGRDYINPEEKTVDFAVAFIPNEMIFSFIYDRLNDIWEEAMRKKVILAGPFSFTVILRLVKQAHDNFRFQKNIHNVIALIHKFRQEYEKFSGELDTLGDRLESANKQFQTVASTRERQLNRVIDQIEGQQILGEGEKKALDD